jgi:hypothetical protein
MNTDNQMVASNASRDYTTVTTKHDKIGYTNNVEVIETALREQFGFNDASYVLKAVAANIWSNVCGTDEAIWNQDDVEQAISCCEARLSKMKSQLAFRARQQAPAREADLSDAIAITKAAAAKADAQAALKKAVAGTRMDTCATKFWNDHLNKMAANDCAHAGCKYVATVWNSAKSIGHCELHKFDDITVINDDDLPAQFRYENAYSGTDAERDAKADAFKAYCKANSIYYYARSKEHFFKWQAFELCQEAGCTKLLMEDLS